MRIRPPPPGRTTATLVSYEYCPKNKRTMPRRLGSFNMKADPDAVPQGVNLAVGVVLNFENIAAIRAFLFANRPEKYPAELIEQVRRELEAENAHRVVTEHQDALDIVESVLRDATASVVFEAASLRKSGVELSNQRSIETVAPEGANRLDMLQAKSNNIRRNLFLAFDAACKEAKLRVAKGGSK